MRRVVFEHSPSLYGLSVREDGETPSSLRGQDGSTYYLAEQKHHYVLYRRAVSGWGALPGVTPDARQQ